MKNTLPKSKSGLIAKTSVVVSALVDHEDAIGLRHVTAEGVNQQFAELLLACAAYESGKLEMTSRKEAYRPLVAEGRAFAMTTRDVLKPHLGNKYGENWNGTGFVHSLTVPSLGPELQPLLLSFQNYLTLRPAHENGVLQITAARAKALASSLGVARAAVLAQEGELKRLWNVREKAAENLRGTLRLLLDELGMKLSPLDPRWITFGFNTPGRKQRPDVPTNVTVWLVGEEAAAVKWDKTPRAKYHRVWMKVDEEAVPVGSPVDLILMLEALRPNALVEVAVSAVNSGGESGRSAWVVFWTPSRKGELAK